MYGSKQNKHAATVEKEKENENTAARERLHLKRLKRLLLQPAPHEQRGSIGLTPLTAAEHIDRASSSLPCFVLPPSSSRSSARSTADKSHVPEPFQQQQTKPLSPLCSLVCLSPSSPAQEMRAATPPPRRSPS